MAGQYTPSKVIIQAVPQGIFCPPAFRLIAYEVETVRTYNPRVFDTLEAVLDAIVPIPGLRSEIRQPSDEAAQGPIFNRVLKLTADDVLRLGLTPRTD
jgi:hypothetical protein